MMKNFILQFSNVWHKADCIAVPIFENVKKEKMVEVLDKTLAGSLEWIWENENFKGKKGQSIFVYTKNNLTKRVLLVGLGKEKEMTVRKFKQAIGSAVLNCQNHKYKNIAIYIPETASKKIEIKDLVYQVVVAAAVATYSYDNYKTDKDSKIAEIKKIELVVPVENKILSKLSITGTEALKVAKGVNLARHLGNIPPTIMTPQLLADKAKKLSQENKQIKVKVFSESELKKLKMNLLLAVGNGSEEETKFIIVEYKGGKENDKPTVLIGKGITFDSGGLSLKPGEYMMDMKFDMLGAASVLGTIKAVADLKIKKNVIGLIPATENMPSGHAYRPDDIISAMNGKTVEIKNTDAEGRLILADALCYAHKYNPKEVIDLATLTGACMSALGLERSGIFSDEEKMVEKIFQAANNVGEQVWRLPLGEEYSEAIKSEVADIKNTGGVGGERYGTASTAAAFLQFFTKDKNGKAYPWLHIDLASAIYGNKGKPWIRVGANGFGVETLVEYLRNF